ncbi:MAG: hypothetical protein FWE06_08750 [Oscillospiraceae bacterium]|nr:hypothetical protein [Oscillospiraceae bacterium]
MSNNVVIYQCPQCGAPINFDVATQSWLCKYCGGQFEKDLKPNELQQCELGSEPSDSACQANFHAPSDCGSVNPGIDADIQADYQAHIAMYNCPSCGAEIITDENTVATFCVYCHNPTIIKTRLQGAYYPIKLIPFKVTKEKAEEMFKNSLKRRPLLPKCFKSSRELDFLTGVYLPFWLFDCDVWGGIHAKATNVRTYSTGRHMITETSHFNVTREGECCYAKIPADASKRMDSKMMDMLEPYDYADMCDFSMGFLSGFMAEKYDQTADDVLPRVDARVKEYIEKKLRNTVTGYTTVRLLKTQHKISDCESMYTLLPVWLLSYKYRGQDWLYAINGQTGRIVGDLPISKGRVATWLGGAFAAAMVVVSIVGGFI